jgi:hypothetical protein
VGACEGDGDAAVTLLLTSLLLQRPGFMQDLAANTLKKTVVASHCTCATRLDGFDQPAQPFVLRDHFESHSGVALRVLWRQNQEITLLKFQSPDKLLLGTGRVLANIDGPEAACRTSIEIALNNVADPCDVRGHHQVIVCGKLDAPVEAYGRLAGINIQHL